MAERMNKKISPGRIGVHFFLALYAVILAYIVGGLIFRYLVPVDLFFGLSIALLLFALAQSFYEIGWAKTLAFFAVTSIVGFLAELLGTTSGFPFGKYVYGDFLGPKILGVPEVVPLVWFVIVYLCFSQSFGSQQLRAISPKRTITMIALTSFGIMAWDLIVDPMFSAYGYWTWAPDNYGAKLYGVPLTNFAGWFAVSFLMLSLIVLAFRKMGTTFRRDNALDSRIAYILLLLDGAVANATLSNYLAILLGSLAMVGFFFASLALAAKQQGELAENEPQKQVA
jgi:uncharacterized membrane protein